MRTSVVALLVVLVAVIAGCSGGEGQTTSTMAGPPTSIVVASTIPTTTTTTEPPFVLAGDEIYLEAAGSAGPEAFTGEVFLPSGPPSTLNIPTTTVGAGSPSATSEPEPPATSGGASSTQVASYRGDTPALYGGSKDKKQADKEGQLAFFDQNPQEAAAFCTALNSDPAFAWSGGTRIEPSQLRAYFDELTPVMLIKDTRVTNYGYRDGKPTPRQSVLQKGQLVLVDLYGVPRVRCECGNPLTPPKPVQTKPRYTGPRWPDFDPTVIIVIQPTTVVIPGFILVDILTGDPFERPPGTDGVADTVRQATDWVVQIDLTLFGHPLSWTAELVLNPDGTVSGTGQGSYQLPNGVTSQGSGADKVNTGTFSADASFTLGLSGILATTPAGKVLRVEPTFGQITLSNVVYDTTGDEQELRARLPGDMQAWIAQTLTTLELPAVDYGTGYATVMAGGDPQEDGAAGSATVTAVR